MSCLNGGKRFRPFLVVESAALFEVPRPNALMAGAALECVHCYSLVHDDLPAMDNDDLRRGQPTAHKAFDEATAILAGDGLLTFAFDILSRHETHADPRVRIELVMALARASGVGGMAGGQMLDLAAEGRFVQSRARLEFSEKDVRTLQAMKTGALLRFACQAGGILAAASPEQRAALERYGISGRPGVPDRRRSLGSRRRSGAGRQTDRQGRRRRQGHPGQRARRADRQGAIEGARHRGRAGAGAVRIVSRHSDRRGKIRRRSACLIQNHDKCVTVDRLWAGHCGAWRGFLGLDATSTTA